MNDLVARAAAAEMKMKLIADLMRMSHSLYTQGKYTEAGALARAVLSMDPQNASAESVVQHIGNMNLMQAVTLVRGAAVEPARAAAAPPCPLAPPPVPPQILQAQFVPPPANGQVRVRVAAPCPVPCVVPEPLPAPAPGAPMGCGCRPDCCPVYAPILLGRPVKPVRAKPVLWESTRDSAMGEVIRVVAYAPEKGVSITARGKRVCIKTSCLEAKCEKVTRLGMGERLMLEGHVQVKFHINNRFGQIVADCVTVNLADSSCEVHGSCPAPCPETCPVEKVPSAMCPFQGFWPRFRITPNP
jgi:hypothetical protein